MCNYPGWLQSPPMLLAEANPNPFLAALYLFGGIGLLLGGGKLLVDGAVSIARRLGWSTLFIGLTVVAFGTSAPELAFNVIAAASGSSDLSFGNIVGSNIANVTLVLGVTTFFGVVLVHRRLLARDLPWVILVSGLACVLAYFKPHAGIDESGLIFGITWLEGLILLLAFGITGWMWTRKGTSDVAEELAHEAEELVKHARSVPVGAGLTCAGISGLAAGGKLTEVGAVDVAQMFGMSQALIGLTIVAIATSLPELVTCVIAAREKHADLVMGNLVGSNVFNILLILGVTSLVSPVTVPAERGWIDLGFMVAVTICCLVLALIGRRKIGKPAGILLLICYAAWVIGTYIAFERP